MRVVPYLVSLTAITVQATSHNPFIQENTALDSYDYVVVGSGPGGGPVAANLAISGYKVLLMDAGGDDGDSWTEKLPAMHLFATEYEETRWNFFVNHYNDIDQAKRDSKMTYRMPDGSFYVGLEPPSEAQPLGILYPRAGTLGGCSRHNALVTMQAHDSDWQYIADLTGDDSWSPDNMRSMFEKIEHNHYLPSTVIGHGFKGWLWTELTSLSLVVEDRKLISLIVAAATAMGKGLLSHLINTVTGLGHVLLADLNAPGQTSKEGLYQVPLAMRDNVRGGPRDFILDTAHATNPKDGSRKYHLDIKLNTLVTKINFDQSAGKTPKAVGVDYLEGKHLYSADPRYSPSAQPTGSGSVNATREIIVAAGSFNTPQLLKLSGVGPRDELASHGIPLVVDLPGVGGNMQDRYEVTVIAESPTPFTITQHCTFVGNEHYYYAPSSPPGSSSPDDDDPCLEQYKKGSNPITKGVYGTNGIALAAALKSSVAVAEGGGEPDLLITGVPAKFKGYFPGCAADALADAKHWAWIILKAHSRNNKGTVMLRSGDPRDMPQIDFFSFNPETGGQLDLQAVYEGFQYGRRAFDDLVALDGGGFEEMWPGKNNMTKEEEDVKQWLKDEAWGHHASCTCPIGADGDIMAVLDGDFRVRGTRGLRVVDASVFPKIPGFYIVLPLYIVSQKASEVIIAQAK